MSSPSLLGYDIHEFGVVASLDDPPAGIAGQLHDRLGVSIAVQRSWRDPYRVLRGWIAALRQEHSQVEPR